VNILVNNAGAAWAAATADHAIEARDKLMNLNVRSLPSAQPADQESDQDDLKGSAVFFASDAGKHITGQILAVDGGLTAVLRLANTKSSPQPRLTLS
jgi:enoyl-[acyl-carrier-protein] reductase (NADH)